MPRRVVWFSAGAPSAVTAKLTLAEHGHDNVVVVYVDPGSEHQDARRFIDDCEHWFEHDVTRLRSNKYVDTWDVWEQTRYLVGPTGARCTVELKKKPRMAFERPTDIHLFGYTVEEGNRIDRFREQNPGLTLEAPLYDRGLTSGDCYAIVERAGIELPAMIRLGYGHANCVGCPKGQMGYWNKIRRDFPDTFLRMSLLERDLGHSVCHDTDGPVWLDQLDPSRGSENEPDIECSLLCALAEIDIA